MWASRRTLSIALLAGSLVACATTQRTPGAAGDRDGDKILDRCDKCPDQPESYNQYQDADGCPETIVVTSSHEHGFSERIYFAEGAHTPLATQRQALAGVVAAMKRGETTKLACVGRFAPAEVGGVALATRRARAVCDWLATHGIDAARLATYAAARARSRRRRELARRVDLATLELAPRHWYQEPLTIQRWDGKQLVPTHERPLLAPTGPARCPHERSDRPSAR